MVLFTGQIQALTWCLVLSSSHCYNPTAAQGSFEESSSTQVHCGTLCDLTGCSFTALRCKLSLHINAACCVSFDNQMSVRLVSNIIQGLKKYQDVQSMLNCSITPFFKFLQRTTCDTLRNENDICIINVSKRITLTHTHIVSHPDGLSSLSLSSAALSRRWETAVSSVSLQSLSLPPPYRLWLRIILTCYAFMPPLSHSLSFSPSLLAFLSLTAQWSCRIPLSLCPLLCLSAFVYIFLHQTDCFQGQLNCICLFLERGDLVRTLGIFHLAAHSFGRLRKVIRFRPGVSGIHRSSGLQPTRVPESRTALIVSVRSVGWRKPP